MTFGPLALLRRAAQTDDLEVMAVNELMGETMLASLLRRDSTFRQVPHPRPGRRTPACRCPAGRHLRSQRAAS